MRCARRARTCQTLLRAPRAHARLGLGAAIQAFRPIWCAKMAHDARGDCPEQEGAGDLVTALRHLCGLCGEMTFTTWLARRWFRGAARRPRGGHVGRVAGRGSTQIWQMPQIRSLYRAWSALAPARHAVAVAQAECLPAVCVAGLPDLGTWGKMLAGGDRELRGTAIRCRCPSAGPGEGCNNRWLSLICSLTRVIIIMTCMSRPLFQRAATWCPTRHSGQPRM